MEERRHEELYETQRAKVKGKKIEERKAKKQEEKGFESLLKAGEELKQAVYVLEFTSLGPSRCFGNELRASGAVQAGLSTISVVCFMSGTT